MSSVRHHPVYLQHICIHPLCRAAGAVQLSSLDGRISYNVSLQLERHIWMIVAHLKMYIVYLENVMSFYQPCQISHVCVCVSQTEPACILFLSVSRLLC